MLMGNLQRSVCQLDNKTLDHDKYNILFRWKDKKTGLPARLGCLPTDHQETCREHVGGLEHSLVRVMVCPWHWHCVIFVYTSCKLSPTSSCSDTLSTLISTFYACTCFFVKTVDCARSTNCHKTKLNNKFSKFSWLDLCFNDIESNFQTKRFSVGTVIFLHKVVMNS